MKLGGSIEGAWLRIAWYASPVAEGAQLDTVDSPLLFARDEVLSAATGPVRAPAEARSARISIMLRPLGAEPARVIADDVRFEVTAAPAPTPTATPASTPTPMATPAPTPTREAAPQPLAAPVATPPASARATVAPSKGAPTEAVGTTVAVGAVAPAATRTGTAAGAAMLRITELLPDPTSPATTLTRMDRTGQPRQRAGRARGCAARRQPGCPRIARHDARPGDGASGRWHARCGARGLGAPADAGFFERPRERGRPRRVVHAGPNRDRRALVRRRYDVRPAAPAEPRAGLVSRAALR